MRERLSLAAALAGFLLAACAACAGATSYSYDARGRLVTATSANGLTTTYAYDLAGNRTQTSTVGPPVANPVAVTVIANSTNNAVPLDVSGSYSSVAVVSGAAHGTATASGTSISYSPTSSYAGPDSFTYDATNTYGPSNPATAQVAVAPLAGNVSDTVAFDSTGNPVPLSVIGAYSSVGVALPPTHGAATASGTSISYTPTSGYSGPDTFLYVASNSVATSPSATVSITVNVQPPIANGVSATVNAYTTNDNIPLNITGGTPTSVAVSTQASHGAATANGITIAYTPASGYSGADNFTYTASNAGGTSLGALATITVRGLTVVASAPLNCPPTSSTYICATSTTSGYTFTGNTIGLTITGGSGSYAYAWNANGDGAANWATGQTTSTVIPSVSQNPVNNSTSAYYACTVTDTGTGVHVTSNSIEVIYTRN